MMLADLGADVIKIEPPAGDSTRQMPGGVDGDTPSFNAVNRGKRSVRLDLKVPEGRALFERLARLECGHPNRELSARRMHGRSVGLGYATPEAAANPRLDLMRVDLRLRSRPGPDRHKGGFDLIAQGVSGIMSVTGEPGHAPVKAGVPLTDLGAGLFALVGILAALESRHRTGVGQHVDTSLVDAGVALSVWEATEYFSGVGVPEAMGSAHRMNAPYEAFRCADGFLTIGAANERLFRRLCDVLGHPEWTTAPEFADNAARVAHRSLLAQRIEAITVLERRAHWLARSSSSTKSRADRSTTTRRCSPTRR